MAMDEHAAEPWRRQYGSVYRFVRRRASSREDAKADALSLSVTDTPT